MTDPHQALEDAGVQADLISPEEEHVQGMEHEEKGDSFPVDISLKKANLDDYDGLLLPGGVVNPDKLRSKLNCIEQFLSGALPAGQGAGDRAGLP